MDIVALTYGSGSVVIPEDAVKTEITPYMWPGHYGEWDEREQTFTAWALVSPSSWRVTLGLRAPPATCLAVGATVSRWRFVRGPQEWFVELRQSSESGPPMQTCPVPLHPVPLQGQGQEQSPGLKKGLAVQQPMVQPPVQPQGKVVVPASQAKEQSAVWRIHTRKT